MDVKYFIYGIDYLPTVLDEIGVDIPDGVNGKSFLPVLRGEEQAGCEQVFKQFHQTSGQCVQNVLEEWLVATDGPALNAFRGRASQQALDDLMDYLADAIGKHADE